MARMQYYEEALPAGGDWGRTYRLNRAKAVIAEIVNDDAVMALAAVGNVPDFSGGERPLQFGGAHTFDDGLLGDFGYVRFRRSNPAVASSVKLTIIEE